MQKDDLNVHLFQYKNWCSPKYGPWFFPFTFRGPFHSKDFKWKKNWGYGITKLNETVEAATGSYSVTANSEQYIYSVPVTKNH